VHDSSDHGSNLNFEDPSIETPLTMLFKLHQLVDPKNNTGEVENQGGVES
jgi:hypothetical protein